MSNEQTWEGQFGNDYTSRCDIDYSPRKKFWGDLFYLIKPRNVLEVGCGAGQNLDIISDYLPHKTGAWGCDINLKAINLLHSRHKSLNAVKCSGFDLPFKDDMFDLVFTVGVLIHQRPEEVDVMMQEIIRVSKKHVLSMEYENEIFLEIPYRGKTEALFRGPYGDIYEKKYGLRLVTSGLAKKEDGFDNLGWKLLSKF